MKRKHQNKTEDLENIDSDSDNVDDQETEVKTKKSKLLPDGYVCRACGESNSHAIYDCPLKISKKEEKSKTKDSVSSKIETVTDSILRKLYVSGLPFSTTSKTLVKMLLDAGAMKITEKDITIIPFPDNQRKCKGVALIKNVTDDDANTCIKLSGTELGKKILDIQIVSNPPPTSDSTGKSSQIRTENKKKKVKLTGFCYRCGGKHSPAECNNPRICYRCQKTDHLVSACPLRNSSKAQD